jgi:hypothetical protein
MKKIIKTSSYILATLIVLLVTQFSILAAGENPGNSSSLSGIQVIGGLAILLLVIFLPLVKGAAKEKRI